MPALEWLRRSRTLLYDAYWPPFHPRLAYDPAEAVATAVRMGADAIRFGTIGKWALYPSRVMPNHPDLGGRDLVAETISHAHRAGIRVIGYVPVAHGLPAAVVESRPGWAFVGADGKPPAGSLHFAGPAVVPVCPFGPYRADLLAIVREVVHGHDVDALYLDGPYYGWIFGGTCHCASCQRLYRAETGHALPGDDADAAARRRHADWVAGRLVALIEDIRAIARERDLGLVFNGCVAEYVRDAWQERVIAAGDGFLLESAHGGIKGVGRGVHLDKVVWNYTHNHTCFPRLSRRELEESDERNGRLAVAQGAAPIVSYAGRFLCPGSDEVPVGRLFADMAAISPHAAGSEPVPHLAVISARDLQPTEGWNKADHAGQDANLYALSGLLRDAGVQQVALPREALDDPRLGAYAAIALAGIAELTAAEAAGVRAFIAGGGGLLVLGPWPAALADLAPATAAVPAPAVAQRLAELRWDQVGAPYDVYLRATAASGLPAGLHPLGELRPVQAKPGAEVLAHAVAGDSGEQLLPALITAGRVAWLPAAVELTWAAGNGVHRDLARLVTAIVDRIASRARPYRLVAPRGIFSNLMQGAGGRLLHLVDEQPDRESVTCRMTLPAAPGSVLYDAVTGEPLPAEWVDGLLLLRHTFTRYACLRLVAGGKE